MFLAAVGIRPNVELAGDAGIPVGHGVLVDDRMRTQVPRVFAAGDVAEHGGQVYGLWPIATEQAQAAAVNALGGDAKLTAETPATILKGVGLELFSIGPVERGPNDEVIVIDRPTIPSYRRLVLSRGGQSARPSLVIIRAIWPRRARRSTTGCQWATPPKQPCGRATGARWVGAKVR